MSSAHDIGSSSVVELEDATDQIYHSSSPTTFDDLTKGQLMYIEDMEAVAKNSCISPAVTLTCSVVSGPPPLTLEHYPSLPLTTSDPTSPPSHPPPAFGSVTSPILEASSPPEAPAFQDPALLSSLPIFSNKTPLSPSTLPLDSIRFKDVTIRKSRKAQREEKGDAYIPLSTRLKQAARLSSSSPVIPQVLRECTPVEPSSP